jgi:hypothetical protein
MMVGMSLTQILSLNWIALPEIFNLAIVGDAGVLDKPYSTYKKL